MLYNASRHCRRLQAVPAPPGNASALPTRRSAGHSRTSFHKTGEAGRGNGGLTPTEDGKNPTLGLGFGQQAFGAELTSTFSPDFTQVVDIACNDEHTDSCYY